MTNSNYQNPILSPFQTRERDPIREELLKNIGEFSLSITVEEDEETALLFKHIPGFVAYRTIVKKDNHIIGIGTGSAVLNRLNKFIERTIRFAYTSSLIDAMVKSTKILDALYITPDRQKQEVEPATDKQKSYLKKLLGPKAGTEIEKLTKDQASEKIKILVG